MHKGAKVETVCKRPFVMILTRYERTSASMTEFERGEAGSKGARARDGSDRRNKDLDGREMVGRDGGALLTKGEFKRVGTRMRNQRR
jgi:hypothetical protein